MNITCRFIIMRNTKVEENQRLGILGLVLSPAPTNAQQRPCRAPQTVTGEESQLSPVAPGGCVGCGIGGAGRLGHSLEIGEHT